MNKSRGKNAVNNIIVGYGAQIVSIILTFLGRKVFLYYLSIDYLGINGLYSNILTVLSLAELGLDSALLYSLYKPTAEGNNVLISSLVFYFKKVYTYLAGLIMLVGLSLIPILDKIINSDLSHNKLIGYYIVFLSNTAIGYFSAHKITMLSAFQEHRYHKLALMCGNVIMQTMQVVVLVCFKSYFGYICCILLTTIIRNIILTLICNKKHPEINKENANAEFDKKPIIKRVVDVFIYKIGVVLINNTDNILISMLVSTAAVGLYSNYCIIIKSIQHFISIITTVLTSTIGNLSVTGNKKRQEEVFDMLLFFYHFIGAVGGIGFTLLMNPFISLWLGKEYLFDVKTVCIIAFNFYISTAISPIWMYREANGMFDKVKCLIMIRAGLNLILSFILGKFLGVFGILFATLVSLVVTSFWYEPHLLFGQVFNSSLRSYWFKQLKFLLITAISFIISLRIIGNLGNDWLAFIIKVLVIISCTLVIFILGCHKSRGYDLIKSYIVKIIDRN